MTKITEYTTARAENYKDFDIEINEYIRRGYQPFGSPYVTESENEQGVREFLVCQAMVRYAEGHQEPITPNTALVV